MISLYCEEKLIVTPHRLIVTLNVIELKLVESYGFVALSTHVYSPTMLLLEVTTLNSLVTLLYVMTPVGSCGCTVTVNVSVKVYEHPDCV